MALMKWEPFEGLTELRLEMNRVFERFFEEGPMRVWEHPLEPAVEVSDTPEAVKDGVLAVTLPKREAAKVKQIPIKAS